LKFTSPMNHEQRTTNYEHRPPNKPPIKPSLPINNAGRPGLNRLYTKYYRLTTNWPSTTVEDSLQIDLFMQNKANFQKSQMNVTSLITVDYENKSNWILGENKPNTNPIQTQSNPKQTQNKANQTQSPNPHFCTHFFEYFTQLFEYFRIFHTTFRIFSNVFKRF